MLPESLARDLEVLVHRLRGDPVSAIRVLESSPAALRAPLDLIELALLREEAADTAAARATLREVADGSPGPPATVAGFLLGEVTGEAFDRDPVIDTTTRRRFWWEYHYRRGSTAEARRSRYLYDEYPLTPALCRAIVLMRRGAGGGR